MHNSPATNCKLLMILYQHSKYHEPLLHGNYHWSDKAMTVFKDKNFMLHETYGVSTIILGRTNRIG